MLLRSSIIAIALLLIYGILVAFGPKPMYRKMQSQWQDNRFALESFFLEDSTPPIVIVGSSLARRLPPFGDQRCIQNLALSGDSALTGLQAVFASGRRPARLLVEINVPDRPANTTLVKAASGIGPRVAPLLRVENVPVNLLFSFLQRHDGSARDVPAPPSALEAQRVNYSAPIPSSTLAGNVEDFAHLITALQARGIAVSLFEMPIHPSLQQASRAVQVRSAFRSRFPDLPLLTSEELSRGVDIHTTDGVHLRQREAAEVARHLGEYIEPFCAGNQR